MDPERQLDRVHIRDLHLRCVVGTRDDERELKQDVVVSITLEADLDQACRSDRIEDTIDYSRLKKKVADLVEKSQFFLLERLAQCIADLCLEEERVQRVSVSVDKPGALRFARSVALQISRERKSTA